MIEYLVIITIFGFTLNSIMLACLLCEVGKANINIDFIEFLIKLYNKGTK